MATVGELRYVSHCAFGPGVVFGNRIADSGEVSDTWFINGERLRTVLSETLADSAKVELPAAQRKALRSAHAAYRLGHKRRVRQTADKPRMRRAFSDRPTWRTEWTWAGDEDSLAPAEEPSAAE